MAGAPQPWTGTDSPWSGIPFGVPDMGAVQTPTPDMANAMDANGDMVSRAMQALQARITAERQKSADQGLWNPETGLPTMSGLGQAARAYAAGMSDGGVGGMMAGIKAYHGSPAGFSLERVNPRTLYPMSSVPDLAQPGSHAFSIKDPAGGQAGIVDTTWNPDTLNLHIKDIQSADGKNTLGLAAIREIRAMLLDQYPKVKSLSGHRITGAGPGRDATQRIDRDDIPTPFGWSPGK